MGVAPVSEYVASLDEEQQRHINAFIEFVNAKYYQLANKISFSIPMRRVGKRCMTDMVWFLLRKPFLHPFFQ